MTISKTNEPSFELIDEINLVDNLPDIEELSYAFIGPSSFESLFASISDTSKVRLQKLGIDYKSFITTLPDNVFQLDVNSLPIETKYSIVIEVNPVLADDYSNIEGVFRIETMKGLQLTLRSDYGTDYWSSIIRLNENKGIPEYILGSEIAEFIISRLEIHNMIESNNE